MNERAQEKITQLQPWHCSSCKKRFDRWSQICPVCAGIATLSSLPIKYAQSKSLERRSRTLKEIAEESAQQNSKERIRCGLPKIDKLLNGGFVLGSVTLLAGEPGIGKSTLALQLAASMGKKHKCIYLSGEETLQQIAMRAERLKVHDNDNLRFLGERELDVALLEAQQFEQEFLIVDSVQTVSLEDDGQGAGGASQVKMCAEYLVEHAKLTGCIVVIVGHITKEEAIAGPQVLMHLVDTVLMFQSVDESKKSPRRTLYVKKHRFGPAQITQSLEMTEKGLI
ncbi:MAG TPA: ATPase domain-containing protein [Steroidobacteraceae bacterium]|nr:ATPase domain-containing protein [Steroidobacteraceae bacterium]